jgi:acyl-CoA synthetase (AMP-forming)/AMP-acid ligase II
VAAFARGERGATAVVEAGSGVSLTYADLDREVHGIGEEFPGSPALVFHFAANSLESAVTFLAARTAGHAVALLDPALKPEFVERLVSLYEPEHISGLPAAELDGYTATAQGHWRRSTPSRSVVHPDLAVLLSTSGSTGSPKFVRLSAGAVEHNARAIARSLDLAADDRAFATLPLHYSYGMSVLTSHLTAGATVVLSDASVIEPRFWEQFATYGATFLAGVPYTYQMLDRIGFLDRDLPTLRSMTQAGGRLPDRLVAKFSEALAQRGVRFYVMYGQTEAAPRMSCLPPEETRKRIGSVGLPLEGGSFTIESDDGNPLGAGADGEVVYRGPNVMMGYADSPEDLALGDVSEGVLRTGDLGHLDEDGFLSITGRSKRIGKVFGVRVSLDEVEGLVTGLGAVAVVGVNDKLSIFHERGEDDAVLAARKQLALNLKVPVQALAFRRADPLPVLPSGKPDYQRLSAQLEGQP